MILIDGGLDSFTLNLRDSITKKFEKHCTKPLIPAPCRLGFNCDKID